MLWRGLRDIEGRLRNLRRTRLLACLAVTSAMTSIGCIPGTVVHSARFSLQTTALPEVVGSDGCRVRISGDYFAGLESYIQRTQLVGETPAEMRLRSMEELLAHSELLVPGEGISASTAFLETRLAPNPLPRRAEAQPFQIYAACLTEEGYFACKAPMANGLRSSIVCPFRRFRWEDPENPTLLPHALEIEYSSAHCTRKQKHCGRGWFIQMRQLRVVEITQ